MSKLALPSTLFLFLTYSFVFSQTAKKLNLNDFKQFTDGKTIISSVKFEGLDSDFEQYDGVIRESNIISEFRYNRFEISANSLFYAKNIEKALRFLKKYLSERGYPEAEVKVLGRKLPKTDKVEIIFQIKRGQRKGIAEFSFTGMKNFTNEELLTQLKQCRDDIFETYFLDKINYFLDKCTRRYIFSKGYVLVKTCTLETKLMPYGYVIKVPVSEGIRYRLGETNIKGLTVYKTKEILDLLGQTQGDIIDGKAFRDFFYEKLKELYWNKGYVQYDAEIDFDYINPEVEGLDGIANVEISIDEGKQYKLLQIQFSGVNEETAKELREMLPIKDGEIYEVKKLNEWIEKINKLEKFRYLDKDRDLETRTDEENGLVYLLVKIREIK